MSSSSRKWTYSNSSTDYRSVEADVTIEWDYHGGGYGWNLWSVVSKEHGDAKLYAAYIDSGCSCYSPYENHPDKMKLSWTPSLFEVASRISKDIRDSDYNGDEDWKPAQKAELLGNFSRAMKELR